MSSRESPDAVAPKPMIRHASLCALIALTLSTTIGMKSVSASPGGAVIPSFGSSGVARDIFSRPLGGATAALAAPGGRTLITGSAADLHGHFGLAAALLDARGRHVTAFARRGTRVVVVGDPTNADRSAAAVRLPGGKFVIAGTMDSEWSSGEESRVAVVRLNPDGTLDPSFGRRGVVVFPAARGSDGFTARYQSAVAVRATRQGWLIVGGRAYASNPLGGDRSGRFLITRLDQRGRRDRRFGLDGWALISPPDMADTRLDDVALAGNGTIVAVGAAGGLSTGRRQDLLVVRLTPAGALDRRFAKSGILRLSPASSAPSARIGGNAVLVQQDGKLLVAGDQSPDFGGAAYLRRFTSAGSADATFGRDGAVAVDWPHGVSRTSSIRAITIDRIGRITVAGSTVIPKGSSGGSRQVATVGRYLASGLVDNTFGRKGVAVISANRFGVALALAASLDGCRYVLAGTSPQDNGRFEQPVAASVYGGGC